MMGVGTTRGVEWIETTVTECIYRAPLVEPKTEENAAEAGQARNSSTESTVGTLDSRVMV